MLHSILLAVNASTASQVAAAQAVDLARRLGGQLLAVEVNDTRDAALGSYRLDGQLAFQAADAMPPRAISRHSPSRSGALAGVARAALEAGVSCRTANPSGIPAEVLLEAAVDSDLIVMGRHGDARGRRTPRGLSGVVEAVLRQASQSVLLAGVEFEPPRRILLGFDGRAPARATMSVAFELAQRLALPACALSAHTKPGAARRQLDAVEHFASAHGVEVETHAVAGAPVPALLELAEEDDLIAIGAFGEGRLHEWLKGSTTADLLNAAPQPVLLHR
ncbi:universal stress protein [Halomonas sp. YLGW01]|uniref:universal stress protein n=1 Tax=Halomonas sp. YLGW01 TaxID=2773308 RepID=UPI00177B494D|nr:universal stress protein [Halomonas sp. YLGW01]